MLRGFLRFVAYALAFWFVYRVIVGAFRHISRDAGKRDGGDRPPARETKNEDPPSYHDVKDARFKDLPNDSSKPA